MLCCCCFFNSFSILNCVLRNLWTIIRVSSYRYRYGPNKHKLHFYYNTVDSHCLDIVGTVEIKPTYRFVQLSVPGILWIFLLFISTFSNRPIPCFCPSHLWFRTTSTITVNTDVQPSSATTVLSSVTLHTYITQHGGVMYHGVTDDDVQHIISFFKAEIYFVSTGNSC